MYSIVMFAIIGFFIVTMALNMQYRTLQKRQETSQVSVLKSKRYNETPIISQRNSFNNFHKREVLNKELIYKTLVRTCNNIYQKGVLNNCPNAKSVYTTWGFAGTVGSSGSLEDAWTNSTTNTFSCGNEDEYGRGLIQQALPKEVIINGRWGYDFTDIDDSHNYPCGFDEIITKE